MVNIVMFIMGMFIDDNSGCVLCGLILVPVVVTLGINPYHFAGMVMANLGLGLVTPPVAGLLYAASAVTGVPLKRYFKYSMYFLFFANIPVLILTMYIPQISTYLPNLVFGTGLGLFP